MKAKNDLKRIVGVSTQQGAIPQTNTSNSPFDAEKLAA
jgi:hypothetical protein